MAKKLLTSLNTARLDKLLRAMQDKEASIIATQELEDIKTLVFGTKDKLKKDLRN